MTFGLRRPHEGVDFIVAVIGLFGVGEILISWRKAQLQGTRRA